MNQANLQRLVLASMLCAATLAPLAAAPRHPSNRGAPPWSLSRAKLRKAQLVNPVAVGHGINKPMFVDVIDAKSKRALGRAVQKDSKNQDKRPVPHHEVAAYALSEVLGFHLVPPTAKTTGDTTAQLFVAGPIQTPGTKEDMELLHLFDYLLQNGDRHPGNFLLAEEDGRVVAIDHSHLVFPDMAKDEFVPYFQWYRGLRSSPPALSPRSIAMVSHTDLRRTARALRIAGLSVFEARGVLHRLANLQHIAAYGMGGDGQGAPADRSRVEAALRSQWGDEAANAPLPKATKPAPALAVHPASAELRRQAQRTAPPKTAAIKRPSLRMSTHADSLLRVYDDQDNRAYDVLDLAQFRLIEAATAPLLQRHAPRQTYFVAVGPRAIEPLSLIAALGDDVAGYLPLNDGTDGVPPPPSKPLVADRDQLFALLDVAIPAGVLASGRTLVVFDGNQADNSMLPRLAPLIEQWAASRGFPAARVATSHAPVAAPAGITAAQHDRVRTLLAPSPTLALDRPFEPHRLPVREDGTQRPVNSYWTTLSSIMHARGWVNSTLLTSVADETL